MNEVEKPKIAVINNLARAGGTMINRCIGSMQDVMMFSEIHPSAQADSFLMQAQNWFGLLPDVTQDSEWDFYDILDAALGACAQQNKSLVIRDWSYLDFIAHPFVDFPVNRNQLMEKLESRYAVKSVAIIRHPIDQWLSFHSLAIFKEKPLLVAPFLDGYLNFLNSCCVSDNGKADNFVRYEDIVAEPDKVFSQICQDLSIKYDQSYRRKWFNYDRVTGDIFKAGRGHSETDIVPLPRKPISREAINRFLVQPNFREILEITGYSL